MHLRKLQVDLTGAASCYELLDMYDHGMVGVFGEPKLLYFHKRYDGMPKDGRCTNPKTRKQPRISAGSLISDVLTET